MGWSWQKLLNYELTPRKVYPDSRVDPALFSEDEFPVYCKRCDYNLRGLEEERCPECGLAFDKGRLLVEQYVLGKQALKRHPFARWCVYSVVGLWLISYLAMVVLYVAEKLGWLDIDRDPWLIDWTLPVVFGYFAVRIVIFLPGVIGTAILLAAAFKKRKKRRRVMAALWRGGRRDQ